ncbi:Kynurenine formamidase [Thermanaeromonas toyohensis ToBE]|uniref:Kynurenine formamidase n=2 Tax=Thermanaeromonas TaxID=202949 RepID=A0A1W1VBE4_9FIRM|nr:Kynurenine formamidase [Thermanaeromonas toyohensis ToBE]
MGKPRVYDVSWPIYPGMPVYKGEPSRQPRLEIIRDYPSGARETRLILPSHTGTHLDAPAHFLPGGKTIEQVDLNLLLGKCQVADLTGIEEKIEAENLWSLDIKAGEFLLFKTRNSYQDVFDPCFVYLSESAARYLVERKVRGIGWDALGIERAQPEHPSHKILLEQGIVILEGLRLKEVEPGEYGLVALPLPVWGAEAAPVRVVLLEGCIVLS